MISKNLCFKLMREDLKRRIWTIALTILSFVFTLLVPVAIKCSSFTENMERATEDFYKLNLINNLRNMVEVNGLVITILLVLAVVWAVSGFRYLHNSKQVDFYHSIPVKRHQLFLASYLNGILVLGIVYFVIQVLSAGLILNTGLGGQTLGSVWWKIFLLNMVYYSMIYTTTVIAMMMTGNIVVSLLGTGVFLGYGPAVIVLIEGYRQMWFLTLFETSAQEAEWIRKICYSSPFTNYMFSLEDFSSKPFAPKIIGAIAVTVVLAIIAYSLYKVRPSEAAGKAMAFKKTETPIKILITIPVAVVFGMFFYSLRSTVFWAVFGTICGSVLTCCLMEIIYHFDFRKLFNNRIHLVGCMAASVLLMLAGVYDWYGFDSWMPNAANIKSASVSLKYSDDWVTYGEANLETDYLGRKGYSWIYKNQTDYQFEHMELTDIYTVMELAKKGVLENQEFRQKSRGNQLFGYTYGNRYIVQYHLNNGKTITRQYYISQDEKMEELEAAIHDNKEYKKGTYPILEQIATDTAAVYFQQYDVTKQLSLTPEQKEHLLAFYQKDLEKLTIATRKAELPIGTIQFRTLNLEEAITFNKQESSRSYVSLEERSYYPVYPSFLRTIQAIEETGIKLVELNSQTITKIKLNYYWISDEDEYPFYEETVMEAVEIYDSDNTRIDMVYDQQEDIEILIPALVFRDYYNLNNYYQMEPPENVEVHVTANFDTSSVIRNVDMSSFELNLKNLSEDDIHRFRFSKQPSYD